MGNILQSYFERLFTSTPLTTHILANAMFNSITAEDDLEIEFSAKQLGK